MATGGGCGPCANDVRWWCQVLIHSSGPELHHHPPTPEYSLQPHVRHVGILSIPCTSVLSVSGKSPPPHSFTHSISQACKSSPCSQETRNIFSFQLWGHKMCLHTRSRWWQGECLKQKQTRWRTSLIPSALGNPPTREAGYNHAPCVLFPTNGHLKIFNHHPLPIKKHQRSRPAGLLWITSPLILN